MLVKNSFEFDARVRREARALIAAGWQVRVVAVHDGGALPLRESCEGIDVARVGRVYGRWAAFGPESIVAPSAVEADASSRGVRERLLWLLRGGVRAIMPMARILNTFVVDQRMALAARCWRPDVVHAHDLNTLSVGARVARRAQARLIYDSHELHTHRAGDGAIARTWAWTRERRHIGGADAVIAASQAYARYLARRYRIEVPEVVRNVPDAEPVTAPVDLHGELDLHPSRLLLLYQGSLQPGRGLEQAIEALAWLPGWELVVIGYGPHRLSLERLAERRGLKPRVHFLGAVAQQQLLRWTAGGDVGLCLIQDHGLSYRWSLPNKLFEYALAGIPVVASDFGEIAEIVDQEGLGKLCQPDDPVQVAHAVATLWESVKHRDGPRVQLGHGISWSAEARRLVSVYSEWY